MNEKNSGKRVWLVQRPWVIVDIIAAVLLILLAVITIPHFLPQPRRPWLEPYYVDTPSYPEWTTWQKAEKDYAAQEKEAALKLVKRLAREKSPERKKEIIISLGEAVSIQRGKGSILTLDVQQEVFNALLGGLDDKDPGVQVEAMWAIYCMQLSYIAYFESPERVYKKLIGLLASEDTDISKTALEVLNSVWRTGGIISHEQKNRLAATYAKQLNRFLFSYLDGDDEIARRNAVELLSNIGGRSCIARLIDLLRAEKSVRTVLLALAKLKAKEAVPELIALLRQDKHVSQVAAALWRLQAVEAVPDLIAAAERSENFRDQGAVIEALGMLRDPRAFDFLIKTAEEGVPQVRIMAYYALANLNDERAMPSLVRGFEEVVTAPSADPELFPFGYESEREDRREEFIRHLARIFAKARTPDARAALVKGLEYPKAHIRANIVSIMMATNPDKETPEMLMEKLHTEEHDLVRRDIIWALGELQSREALALLKDLLIEEEEEWKGKEKVFPPLSSAPPWFWQPKAAGERLDWKYIMKPAVREVDLSKLPGPSINIVPPDPFASSDYYLGDALRWAIAEIEREE